MRRARIQYFSLLGLALALFAVAAALTPAASDVWIGLIRFCVLGLAIGSSIATWYTGVMIASVHKRSWALLLSTSVVVIAGVTYFVSVSLGAA